MTTLAVIAYNLAGSIGVFGLTIIAFGCAVKSQNTFIASRCTARPPTVIYNPKKKKHPSQDRGNPTLGWIFWVMRLTYGTMLRGVPGTGTRDGGLSGALLKVNLDGIVLLRFHHLGLRVCALASFLYLVVVLPIYATAQCSRIGDDYNATQCQGANYNLTDYQQLTLANVPPLTPDPPDNFGEVVANWFLPDHGGILARLYAVVFVTWIVTYYALRELKMEWGDVLAMRRVYYLEADHFNDRKEEMEQIRLQNERENSGEEDLSYLHDRKPWIPDPEHRETVPNIELYSVLVGGLPSLPTEVVDQEEVEAVFSRKQSINWQLSVTTAFFDHCVPNQPGFSSSVAAVTILPSAAHLTDAWNQWYRVAGKLRRLRFIRREINKRKFAMKSKSVDVPDGNSPPEQSSYFASLAGIAKPKSNGTEFLGSTDDLQVESRLLCALHFGPEQTAAYTREFASGAGNLAPYGWNEGRVTKASLKDLQMMERAAVEQVHEAYAALREAQERIAEDSQDDSGGNLSDDELHVIMNNANSRSSSVQGRMSTNNHGENANEIGTFSEQPLNSAEFNRNSHSMSKATSRSGSDMDSSGSLASYKDERQSSAGSSAQGSYQMALKGGDDEDSIDGNTPSNLSNNNRAKRSMSIGSTYSTMSYESSDAPRKGLLRGVGDLGSVVMKMTGLVRTPSSESLDNLAKGKQRKSRGDIQNARLPSDLGLEAGLWMEHKKSGSQHTPRKQPAGTRRKMSSTRESTEGPDSSSANAEAQPSPQRRSKFVRVKEFGKGGLNSTEDRSSTLSTTESGSISIDENPDGHRKNVAGNGQSPSTSTRGSIWSRLEQDNQRKQKLKTRLSDMRIVETTPTGDQSADPDKDPRGLADIKNTRHGFGSSGLQVDGKVNSHPGSRNAYHATRLGEGVASIPVSEGLNPSSKGLLENHRIHGDFPPQHHQPRMKPLDENETDDDDSVDMDALAAAVRAYGGEPGLPDDSHRSFSSRQVEDNLRIAFDFEEKAGLRHRDVGANDVAEETVDVNDKWARVMAVVQESSRDKSVHYETKERLISSGQWRIPTFADLVKAIRKKIKSLWKSFKLRLQPPDIVDDLVRDSSYAVVTFTSRQAAVAARHCLADSRGHDRWITVGEIPSPPLADAPVCNMSSFRGCVRPVTLSISDKQKIIRHTLAMAALVAIYFFYTIPLVAAQELLSPDSLSRIFPDIKSLQESSAFLRNLFVGFIPALVWIVFVALCPPMFKMIANFGSNATSSITAENSALSYFWWFMLVSAFTGTSFATAMINGFDGGLNLGAEIQNVLGTAAADIPTQVSATWLNWMIVRAFAVLPTQYLLQLNSFIFSCLGLKCCARTSRGGGAGGPVPYRIYVDSGVVMLCLFALAPASPLIAPAAFVYFLTCTPILRWTVIFLYRPKFDIGGGRFPFMFDICISGMIAGQIFLVAMMVLKRAVGPAVAAFCPMVPTIWFRYFVRRRYLRAFNDAALLQTSLLDGWDTNVETSQEKREEFRQFLVDCHKAAYVPVCIAGDQSTLITAEPAVVVPTEFDEDCESVLGDLENDPSYRDDTSTFKGDMVATRIQLQPGAMSRRASTFQPPQQQAGAMMRRASVAVKRRVVGDYADDSSFLQISTRFSPQRISSPRKRIVPLAMKDGPLMPPPLASKGEAV